MTTPAPTSAPAPAPKPERKPRAVPVQHVTITAKPGAEPVVRLVQASEAAARTHVDASVIAVREATPQEIGECYRLGIEIEQAGEGGGA